MCVLLSDCASRPHCWCWAGFSRGTNPKGCNIKTLMRQRKQKLLSPRAGCFSSPRLAPKTEFMEVTCVESSWKADETEARWWQRVTATEPCLLRKGGKAGRQAGNSALFLRHFGRCHMHGGQVFPTQVKALEMPLSTWPEVCRYLF